MKNGTKLTTGDQLEISSVNTKRYILAELLKLTNAITDELDLKADDKVFFAGTSGLVPAPAAGDNEKFLRGDGQWVTLSSGSTGGSDTELVLSNTASTVNGAMWLDSGTATTAGDAITLSTLMPATVVNGSMWLEV